ncbi:hypothetical protein LIER_39144 [Lithospermum erythrorhizon]|uniref:Uncharacterized protein n=1 Tax=Lithospermum erythrorhizon TaxID=34254 RepID=A0AAV3QFN9_LITER
MRITGAIFSFGCVSILTSFMAIFSIWHLSGDSSTELLVSPSVEDDTELTLEGFRDVASDDISTASVKFCVQIGTALSTVDVLSGGRV